MWSKRIKSPREYSLGESGRQVDRKRESEPPGVRASGISVLVSVWDFASAQKSLSLDDSISEQIIKQWLICSTHLFIHPFIEYLLSPIYIIGSKLDTKDI